MGTRTTKVWNLMYRVGTAGRICSSADNPVTRKVALDGAAVVTKNGWRVWVEHHTTGEIIHQNPAEVAYQKSLAEKRIIEFAEANVPGFDRQQTKQAPDEPDPGYWTQLASEQLALQPGLKPGKGATACEKMLWRRLVGLQAAAYAVLSDIDDDGVAEGQDMAVLRLRDAAKVSDPRRNIASAKIAKDL